MTTITAPQIFKNITRGLFMLALTFIVPEAVQAQGTAAPVTTQAATTQAVPTQAVPTDSAPAAAQETVPVWVIDTAQSTLRFEAVQQGARFEGGFKGFSGDIHFDANRPADSHAKIAIDMRTVDSQSGDRDQSLLGKDWFFVESFPAAHYVVSKFDKLNENQFIARGTLELRGVQKSIDLPLSMVFSKDEQARAVATATGEVTLQRLDFGVGQGDWRDTQAVGNPVKVKVSVVAVRTQKP